MAEVETVLSNEPKTWVEQKVDGVLLPATVGKTIQYDPTVDRFRDKEEIDRHLYKDAEDEKTKLLGAMKKFQMTAQDKADVPSDTTRIFTWDEVVSVMNRAASRYQKKEKGPLACVEKFFAKVGDSGKTFNAWLSLLPDGCEYTSIVCGAFRLIINAAMRAKAIRDMIFTALGRIPATLETARLYHGLWQSTKLHQAFSKLYTAILKVFEHILTLLSESSWRTATKQVFKQGRYGEELEEFLHNVERCAVDVREEANICSHWVIGSVNQKIDIHTTSMNGMRVTVEKMGGGIGQMSNRLEDIQNSQGRVEEGLAETVNVLNKCYTMFQDKFRDFKVKSQTESHCTSSRKYEGEIRPRHHTILDAHEFLGPSLTQKTLRKILRYDPQISARDIRKTTAEGRVFSLHDQERAEYLMNHADFKEWLTSPESRFMLVNGNAEHERISPASFACGILVSSLISSKQTITLSFFCGLHTDSRDDERGAPKLLGSLIGQLLTQYDLFDLTFLKSSQLRALEELKVGLLRKILPDLLRQLPEGYVVLCMIDGISFYEERSLREDTCQAISALIDLMDDDDLSAIMKLMVTSAAMSRWVSKSVARDRIFNIPEDMEYSNQGFNCQAFEKDARRQINDLEDHIQGESQWPTDSSDEYSDD